jgi:hypothetical protein
VKDLQTRSPKGIIIIDSQVNTFNERNNMHSENRVACNLSVKEGSLVEKSVAKDLENRQEKSISELLEHEIKEPKNSGN